MQQFGLSIIENDFATHSYKTKILYTMLASLLMNSNRIQFFLHEDSMHPRANRILSLFSLSPLDTEWIES